MNPTLENQNEQARWASGALVRLLETTAYNLYLAALLNPRDDAHVSLHRRMHDPQPGDVVVERSTLGFKRGDGTRCGVLLRKERVPTHTPDEWKAMGGGDEEIPTQLAWVIRLDFDDGREFRWTNADFIAIPPEVWNWWPTLQPNIEMRHDRQ